MRKTVLLILPTLLLGACTWGINPTPASENVRTAWNGDVSGCRYLGKITVSVMDHVGPVDRNNIKVSDELQVMARNQAATMNADTIKPLADPSDGSQPWGAYQCGSRVIQPAAAPGYQPQPAQGSGIQTYPVKGN